MKFQTGQKVRLKTPVGIDYLQSYVGRDLTVSHAYGDYLSFKEDEKYGHYTMGAWGTDRFEAVVEPVKKTPKTNVVAPNKVARAKDGRFASRTKAPVVLRNGSLYNVLRKSKGKRVLQVARLKVLTKDGKSAVMSRHGKLFFAKPDKLTLAPQSDVVSYLSEGKSEQQSAK